MREKVADEQILPLEKEASSVHSKTGISQFPDGNAGHNSSNMSLHLKCRNHCKHTFKLNKLSYNTNHCEALKMSLIQMVFSNIRIHF